MQPSQRFRTSESKHCSLRPTPSSVAAVYNSLPWRHEHRNYVEVGGLMSYGTDFVDSFRQVGVYAGKILSCVKPAELPVTQPTSSSLLSISKPPERLASTCHPVYSWLPTR